MTNARVNAKPALANQVGVHLAITEVLWMDGNVWMISKLISKSNSRLPSNNSTKRSKVSLCSSHWLWDPVTQIKSPSREYIKVQLTLMPWPSQLVNPGQLKPTLSSTVCLLPWQMVPPSKVCPSKAPVSKSKEEQLMSPQPQKEPVVPHHLTWVSFSVSAFPSVS